MAKPNEDTQRAIVEVTELGLDVGTVYKIASGWPQGTKLVFTDGGIFVTTPGVPGAYCLTDGRRVLFRATSDQ